MTETRSQLKERLQAAGVWSDYLTLRTKLAGDGMKPAQARLEAARQINTMLAERTPETKAGPPLCNRCEKYGRPRCDYCLQEQWDHYQANNTVNGQCLCYWCWRDAVATGDWPNLGPVECG